MPNIQFPATAEGLPKFLNRNHGSLFLEFTPDLRKRIEQTVEHLIWLLDTFDGDSDFEDDGTAEEMEDAEPDQDDEPSLAAPETTMRPLDWYSRIPPFWLGGEPSGFVLKCSNGNQAGWSAGECSDMEMEEGNDEPDVDDEYDFRNAPAEL